MTTPPMRAVLLAGMAAFALAGCAKKHHVAELPPAPVGAGTTAGNGADMAGQGMNGADANAPGGPNSPEAFLRSVRSDRIFFATDKSDIDADSQTTLQSQAQWLAAHPTVHVVIEGHCDERGTRDYNLALGQRRANAARDYLASLGIAADRMQTISYGKERPAVLGSNEEAWAKNRRAVTVVVR